MCLKSVQTGYVRIQENIVRRAKLLQLREDVGLEGYHCINHSARKYWCRANLTTRMNVRISEALKLFLEYIKIERIIQHKQGRLRQQRMKTGGITKCARSHREETGVVRCQQKQITCHERLGTVLGMKYAEGAPM